MPREPFQRARRPNQVAERRAVLLTTAEQMLAESPSDSQFSLNELAKRAGMAKSNVYRYFESREAILLEVLRRQWSAWFDELKQHLAVPLAPGGAKSHHTVGEPAAALQSIDAIATTMAHAFAARPLLGKLCAILATVLEHNVQPETIRSFKLESLQFVQTFSDCLHAHNPVLSTAQYQELFHAGFSALIGLWSISHPSETVKQVLQEPELAAFRHDFERDFARHLSLLARGLWLEAHP